LEEESKDPTLPSITSHATHPARYELLRHVLAIVVWWKIAEATPSRYDYML
jgi:hypothetical protein